MKRKHSEDVDDNDFSFAHLFPKSRRLDAELLSSMVEEVPATTSLPAFEQQQEHLPSPTVTPSGDDKAIVLYNPSNSKSTFPFLKSPASPEFSVTVKSDLIPALKDYLYGTENSRLPVTADEGAGDESNGESNDRLAVVPWVAPQHHLACGQAFSSGSMEAENMEIDMMDIEDNMPLDNEAMAEQLQQCMSPQLHQNMPTPITW